LRKTALRVNLQLELQVGMLLALACMEPWVPLLLMAGPNFSKAILWAPLQELEVAWVVLLFLVVLPN
jgi:hypothetical protein